MPIDDHFSVVSTDNYAVGHSSGWSQLKHLFTYRRGDKFEWVGGNAL